MKKLIAIDLEQIRKRITRGSAFLIRDGNKYRELQEKVKEELEIDFKTLSETEFRLKYDPYIYK